MKRWQSRKGKAPFNIDPYSKLNVNAIVKKWMYFIRMTVGAESIGVDYLPLDIEGRLYVWIRIPPNSQTDS